MTLPQSICSLIRRLEDSGYAAYAVGGCVRDACLGQQPQDYDLCTAAVPEEICRIFQDHSLVLAGIRHGTVGVVTEDGVVEITTFRTEGDYADNRHPGWVAFVENVEADLARRDFTINAMAYSPSRGLADPFGGQADLDRRLLRAVGEAPVRFREDALRILRGVRFAVRFHLTVEPQTAEAMADLRGLMAHLAKERIWEELRKLLPLVRAEDLLRFQPVLSAVIPELSPMVNFSQHSPHHAYDLFTHTAQVTQAVPPDLVLRWAALLHDVGKVSTFVLDDQGQGHFPNHAQVGAQMAEAILLRLKAPTALRQQVVELIRRHASPIPTDKRLLRRWLARLGPERLEQLLILQEADSRGTGVPKSFQSFAEIREILAQIQAEDCCLSLKSLAVNGRDLLALGYEGREIGTQLQWLFQQVLDERLPNDRQALLDACQKGRSV